MRDVESNPGATFESIRRRARKLIHTARDAHRMCRQDITLVTRSTGRGARSGLLLVKASDSTASPVGKAGAVISVEWRVLQGAE